MSDATIDSTLAALSLLEACIEDNLINRNAILTTSSNAELMSGLAAVGLHLLLQVAAETGSTPGEVVDNYRTFFLGIHTGAI